MMIKIFSNLIVIVVYWCGLICLFKKIVVRMVRISGIVCKMVVIVDSLFSVNVWNRKNVVVILKRLCSKIMG